MTRVAPGLALLLLLAAPDISAAQAPVVTKVEPPNWWANHTINPVRVLVRGQHLAGARVECPTATATLSCGATTVNASGTYAFVSVTISPRTKPGAYPLRVRTAHGTASAPFSISATLPTMGRFQGFGPDDAMYLLMPDRFANGDTTNDRPAKSPAILDRAKGRYYHGGDLAGVRQKLPYLKSLGITALWLNPVYDNNDGLDEKETYDGQPTTGYHGYGAIDMYAVDEHLGTVAEFKSLVDDAHRQGIKIILDMVANHTGPYHPWANDAPTATWFHGTAAEHPNNTWQTWTLASPYAVPEMQRATLDGWFIDVLPDFNQDDPEVARYLIQNTLWWVGMSGMDGIRQDTWPYVPRPFWRDWMRAIKAQYPAIKVVGEVLDGDPAMIAFFEGSHRAHDGIRTGVDKMFDFPLYYAIRDAFGNGKPVRGVAQMLMRDHLYDDPNSLVTLAGLHDVPRFMSEPGATPDGLKLAYTLLMTTRGTPLVYYGDEIVLGGGADPDNRRDFPGGWLGDARNAFDATGRTPAEAAVFAHVQRLLALRAEHPALRRGTVQHLLAADQQFVYRRGGAVIAINNDTKPVEVTLRAPVTGRDVLGSCAAPRANGATTTLSLPARGSCIYMARP